MSDEVIVGPDEKPEEPTLRKDGNKYPPYIYEIVNENNGTTKVCVDCSIYSNFLASFYSTTYFNKTIYIYDAEKNIYRPQTNEIETHIRNVYNKYKVTTKLQPLIAEMMAHLTAMGCSYDYPFNNSPDTIPVRNGVIKINYEQETFELLPHGPEHLFTYKLNVEYKPEARNCFAIPLLKRMVDPENIKTLIQIPAQALLQMQTGHSYKKAYILQGEPHAGKTSYLKLLYSIFGDDFTAAVSLQHLCTDRFVGGNLEGKLLNIYDDLEDVALEVIDQFKTLTGDCRHGIERKYQTSYTGKITAVHIFTCNYPPEYPEKIKRDAAFWARWEYIKFPFAYPVNPNFYSEWYTDERLSSFFNLVLSAMITIKKRGLLANSEVQDVMMNWSTNSDPLYSFIDWLFAPNNTKERAVFSKRKLFDNYMAWCVEGGVPEHKRKNTLKAFTSALQAHGIMPERIYEKKISYEVYTSHIYVQRYNVKVDLGYVETLSI